MWDNFDEESYRDLLGKATWVETPKTPKKRQRPESARTAGYVYLMKMLGFYKIGSSRDPASRLEQIDTSPFPMSLVHQIASAHPTNVEWTLHMTFRLKHVRAEWFLLDEDEVSRIRSVLECDCGDDLPKELQPPAQWMESISSAMSLFGENLRQLREARGMSRKSLAAISRICLMSIANIETGKSLPLRASVDRLAVAIGISVAELISPLRPVAHLLHARNADLFA